MTSQDKTPFEVIYGKSGSGSKMQVPEWWQSSDRGAEGSGGGSPPQRTGWRGWLMRPVMLRLNVAAVLAAAAVFAATLVIAYELGARRSGPLVEMADAASSDRMADHRRQPINHELMRDDGGDRRDQSSSNDAAPSDTPDGQASAGGQDRAREARPDGRIPGLNYFCLETIPIQHRAEAERAVAFLERNGVDAALIPVNNSRLQLTALRGFEKPYAPAAQDYKSLLQALGRAWKAEHQGWRDWHDVYPVKCAVASSAGPNSSS